MDLELVNKVVAFLAGVGVLGSALVLLLKGVDFASAWVTAKVSQLMVQTNQNAILSQTLVDDLLWETVVDMSNVTFKTVKETLKRDLEDGKIDKEEYVKMLHEDLWSNFTLLVSENKKKILETAFQDLKAAVLGITPAVVESQKSGASNPGN